MSVQNSSFFTARLQRPHFDVVLRKLIFELQAFPVRQVDIGNIVHPADVNDLVDVTQSSRSR